MARTVVLQDSFHRGVRQDDPIDAMPEGALWDARNLIPGEDGRKLVGRGPYTEASADISLTTATASQVRGGFYAPFAAAAKNLAIDEDGRLYSIAAAGTVTDIGAAVVVAQNPVFHRSKVIIPASGGATAPKYYDGTTLGNLAGSPPNAIYAAVWGDYTLLANTTANPNRLWFSDPGDPTVWDTTNSWWDFSYPITGLAALGNVILVFHDAYTSRLRGSIPPPGADLIADDPMFSVGCADPRSIASWEDRVIFANASGIYMTDGAAVQDITYLCGMSGSWHDMVSQWSKVATATIAGGVLNNYYFVNANVSGLAQGSAMIDLRRMAWWPTNGYNPSSYWKREGASDELYFGARTEPRVRSLASFFTLSTAVGAAKGQFSLQTPFYESKPGSKGWRRFGISHKFDVASVAATATLTAYTDKDLGTSVALGTFAESEGNVWKPCGFSASGASFKIDINESNNGYWAIDAILADVNAREESRP